MAALVFFFSLWMVCKGIKALFRSRPVECELVPVENKVSKSLAALDALQKQRELIQEQLSDIEQQLDNCPPEKVRIRYMDRKTVLLGKLATVEQRIYRMCA